MPLQYSLWLSVLSVVLFAGCASQSPQWSSQNLPSATDTTSSTASANRNSKYYLDDGPLQVEKQKLLSVPDAIPRDESIIAATLRPYTVLGKNFIPLSNNAEYREQGIGSWYGKRYHGRKTASGEIYDMFAMTAAHPTLPLPSYARITSIKSGVQVIVRVNDRGPFLYGRIIDLSYTAALKLGYVDQGVGEVLVERITPEKIRNNTWQKVEAKIPAQSLSNTALTGIFIQLGAYRSVQNAENQRKQIELNFPTLNHKLRVKELNGYYRVISGPYADEATAKIEVERFFQNTKIQPYLLRY